MTKIARKLLLILVLIVEVQLGAKAQGDPGDIPDDPDAPIPLDPGSWILVAAGVGYGVKKWRDSKQLPGKQADDTA